MRFLSLAGAFGLAVFVYLALARPSGRAPDLAGADLYHDVPAASLAPVPAPGIVPVRDQIALNDGASARDSAFAALVVELSEPGGYFDSDNLISNEASYLHVIGKIDRMRVRGGAFIGVGPDQSFSYIARVRPEIAFMIDIRRDNLLEHLLFKAIFQDARNRVEYLCLLLGKPLPAAVESWSDSTIVSIIAYIDRTGGDIALLDSTQARLDATIRSFGLDLSDQDMATVERFHTAFVASGLSLKFNSIGRPSRPGYPTLRDLILETDLEGTRASYLATEDAFQFVRQLQARGLIVPVVGDLAGPHALRAIGDEVRARGLVVSAFYTSNVEFYLMRDFAFDRFAENVATLPHDETSVLIRSLFQRTYLDPAAVSGYYSSQLMQTIETFNGDIRAGGYDSYADLITRNPLDLRR